MMRLNEHTGVILDTDIGYDADDLFALLLLLNSPELTLDLIVTGDEMFGKRALLIRRILQIAGNSDIPVVAGADLGNKNFIVDELIAGTPDLGTREDPIEAMKRFIDSRDEVVYINIQGFSNLSALITKYPDVTTKLKVFQMGCALDYSRRENWIEHNVRIDVPSARNVLRSKLDLTLVMAQTTNAEEYCFNEKNPVMKRLTASTDPLHKILLRSILLFHEKLAQKGIADPWPYAHDPLLVSVVLGKEFVRFEDAVVSMNERGELLRDPDGKRVRASLKGSDALGFMRFLEERLFRSL